MVRDVTDTILVCLKDLGIGTGGIVVLSVLVWIGTLIALPIIIIALPPGYLTHDEKLGATRPRYALWHFPYLVVKTSSAPFSSWRGWPCSCFPVKGC